MPSTRVRQPSAKARAAAGEASPVSSSTPVASTSKATTASTSTGSRSRTAASGTSSTSNSTEAATRKSARGRGKGNKAATATTDETLSKKGRANDDDDDNDNDAEQDDAPSDLEETHQMSVDEDENVDGDDQDDTYDDHMGMSNSKEPDFTLYCICLGLAGEQPMIQCDHCSNWFHFSCVGIDDDTAAMIESYCCDICAGMGKGVTCEYFFSLLCASLSAQPASSSSDSSELDRTALSLWSADVVVSTHVWCGSTRGASYRSADIPNGCSECRRLASPTWTSHLKALSSVECFNETLSLKSSPRHRRLMEVQEATVPRRDLIPFATLTLHPLSCRVEARHMCKRERAPGMDSETSKYFTIALNHR